jgi:hypothetical protein
MAAMDIAASPAGVPHTVYLDAVRATKLRRWRVEHPGLTEQDALRLAVDRLIWSPTCHDDFGDNLPGPL